MSFIFAPPSALMPPDLLMSSIAISAPMRSSTPCRAHGPESGTISATSTSFGCCAETGTVIAAAAIATATVSTKEMNNLYLCDIAFLHRLVFYKPR